MIDKGVNMLYKILILITMYTQLLIAVEIKVTSPYKVTCVKYTEYSACYSNDLNRSVYSIENLTLAHIKKASTLIRKNSFHEDLILKTNIIINFIGSYYDKGHLAPCGNMSTAKAQYESFSMVNMIPQYYSNNRGNWKKLENDERNLTLSMGKLTVVSGTYGSNGNLKTSDIPKHVFKIFKSGTFVKVYVIDNNGTQDINETNITELSKASGYIFNY